MSNTDQPSGQAIDDLKLLVRASRSAQTDWERQSLEARAHILRCASRWVIENTDQIRRALEADQGQVHLGRDTMEIAYTAATLLHWANNGPEWLATKADATQTVRWLAHGIVLVIGPGNFPLTNGFGDCIPALLAGNSVILKPSQRGGRSAGLMATALSECGLPANVFVIAEGGPDIALALIDFADFISFTGSVNAGTAIASRAALKLTPASLAVGGKDTMIVLSDADIEASAVAAAYHAMQHGGQACTALERAYVEQSVYESFARLVSNEVAKLELFPDIEGAGFSIGVAVGTETIKRMQCQVEDAQRRGATVLCGGQVMKYRGLEYYAPTIITGTDHTMLCMIEESFGPLLGIMPVAHEEQATELANQPLKGLHASVWTRDIDRGQRVASALKIPAVTINDAVFDVPEVGWRSTRGSDRHGSAAIRRFAKEQVMLTHPQPSLSADQLRRCPRQAMLARQLIGQAEKTTSGSS